MTADLMTGARNVLAEIKEDAEQRKALVVAAAEGLSQEDLQEISKQIGVRAPSRRVNDLIWGAIVAVFALAFLMAAVSLILGRFVPISMEQGAIFTSSDTVVTIFTTTAAFLAGLLAPSPLSGGNTGGGAR